ncbi:hypothetical protein V8C44DRAFT_317062 [Trichoderma aethiopicum]
MKQHLINFLNVIAARAEQEIDYVMPEYTDFSEHSLIDRAIGCSHTGSPLQMIWRGRGR